MKRLGSMALAAIMLGSLPTSALAADTTGWTMVGEETVRYFLPGNTPPDPKEASLAPADRAAELATGAQLATNEWLLVGSERVRYFMPDAGNENAQLVGSTFVDSRELTSTYYIGLTDKIYGGFRRETPYTEPDSSRWTVVDRNAQATRISIPVYVVEHRPWSIFRNYGQKSTTINTNQLTYRVDKPSRTSTGLTIMNTRTFTRLEDSTGSIHESGALDALRQVASTGSETVIVALDPYERLIAAAAVDVKDPTAASGPSRNASFVADASTGTQATRLTGSRKRVTFRADAAIASQARPAVEFTGTRGGGTTGGGTTGGGTTGGGTTGGGTTGGGTTGGGTTGGGTTGGGTTGGTSFAVDVIPEAVAVTTPVIPIGDPKKAKFTFNDWVGTYEKVLGGNTYRVTLASGISVLGHPNMSVSLFVNGTSYGAGSVALNAFKADATSFDDKVGLLLRSVGPVTLSVAGDKLELNGKFKGGGVTGTNNKGEFVASNLIKK